MSSVESPYGAFQSSHGGDLGTISRASDLSHCGKDGAGFHDGSTVKDNNSINAQIVDKGVLSLLKTELIPRSYEMSNSSVMKAGN